MPKLDLAQLNAEIVVCRTCPRLVEWREWVAREKRRAFADEVYWGRPIPNFGDPDASGLIVGLAPAAHGGNRTGRMFTGDRSGDWLYRALFKAGIANKPMSLHIDDGLALRGVMITALVHCAPPDNKPTPPEFAACGRFLRPLLDSRTWNSILCLGGLAWNATLRELGVKPPKFTHGTETTVGDTAVYASYHPSQQNTFTGRLTEVMLDDVVGRFWRATGNDPIC